jgi:hypothetical protein
MDSAVPCLYSNKWSSVLAGMVFALFKAIVGSGILSLSSAVCPLDPRRCNSGSFARSSRAFLSDGCLGAAPCAQHWPRNSSQVGRGVDKRQVAAGPCRPRIHPLRRDLCVRPLTKPVVCGSALHEKAQRAPRALGNHEPVSPHSLVSHSVVPLIARREADTRTRSSVLSAT